MTRVAAVEASGSETLNHSRGSEQTLLGTLARIRGLVPRSTSRQRLAHRLRRQLPSERWSAPAPQHLSRLLSGKGCCEASVLRLTCFWANSRVIVQLVGDEARQSTG